MTPFYIGKDPNGQKQKKLAKLHPWVRDELFDTYWEATRVLKTRDLVCFVDTLAHTLVFDTREAVITKKTDWPKRFMKLLQRPASSSASNIDEATAVFWFVLILSEETIVTPLIGRFASKGGTA